MLPSGALTCGAGGVNPAGRGAGVAAGGAPGAAAGGGAGACAKVARESATEATQTAERTLGRDGFIVGLCPYSVAWLHVVLFAQRWFATQINLNRMDAARQRIVSGATIRGDGKRFLSL